MSRNVALMFGLIAASLMAVGCGSTNAPGSSEATSTGTTGLSGNGIGANGNSSSGSSGSHGSTSTASSGSTGQSTIGASTAASTNTASGTTGTSGSITTTQSTNAGTTGTTGGPPQCNIGCSNDSICQSDCAEAPAGDSNCCDTSGVCYLNAAPTCPGQQGTSSGSSTGSFY